MSNVTRRGSVKPSLNITPLIDVVFLLIVFFLLVNRIVTDENPELKLPDLEEPVTIQAVADNRLIISIVPKEEWDGEPGPGSVEGEVLARGGDARFVTIGGKKFDLEVSGSLDEFHDFMVDLINQRRERGDLRFLFRVDATVYYYQVVPVMDMLQTAMVNGGLDASKGETMIDIVAYMPD